MPSLATFLAVTSGFILAGYHGSPANVIATSLAIDASLAPLTAVVATRHGRSLTLWITLGFGFGAWALVWILLFGRRRPSASNTPSTPEAA
jgi:hypothetical protein